MKDAQRQPHAIRLSTPEPGHGDGGRGEQSNVAEALLDLGRREEAAEQARQTLAALEALNALEPGGD